MNNNELENYINGILSELIENKITRQELVESIMNIDPQLDTDTIQKIILGLLYDHTDKKKEIVKVSLKIAQRL